MSGGRRWGLLRSSLNGAASRGSRRRRSCRLSRRRCTRSRRVRRIGASVGGEGAGRQPGDGAADLGLAQPQAPPRKHVQAVKRQALPSTLTNKAIRRGVFHSVPALIAAIDTTRDSQRGSHPVPLDRFRRRQPRQYQPRSRRPSQPRMTCQLNATLHQLEVGPRSQHGGLEAGRAGMATDVAPVRNAVVTANTAVTDDEEQRSQSPRPA